MHHHSAFTVSRRAALKGLGLVAAGLAVSTVAPALRMLPALAASDLKKSSEMRMQMAEIQVPYPVRVMRRMGRHGQGPREHLG